MSEIFDQNGQILQKVKTEEEIDNFCGDEFGQFYFPTFKTFPPPPKTLLFLAGIGVICSAVRSSFVSFGCTIPRPSSVPFS